MTPLPRTPLDTWTAVKLGVAPRDLTPEALARHQAAALPALVAYLQNRSPYYRSRLAGVDPAALQDPAHLERLPLTPADDLRRDPLAFLCVSQRAVARVVTLETSGTTGPPKRVFFTAEDLEGTMDFFRCGMATFTAPGDRVLVLLPGAAPWSVGDLLQQALARMGVEAAVMEPPVTTPRVAERIRRQRPAVLVGRPVQVLALARAAAPDRVPPGILRAVLLTTDCLPRAVVEVVRRTWGAEVYDHYGMTEMGYGGGVECDAHAGYHLREPDLWFEIVHPATGRPVQGPEAGEVVVTTLTRRGMPLLRYRTGDLAQWMEGPCPCGSPLRRLGRVLGRLEGTVPLGGAHRLSMADLDEALFPVEGVIDFTAAIQRRPDGDHLRLALCAREIPARKTLAQAAAAVRRIPAVAAARKSGHLILDPLLWHCAPEANAAAAKRRIHDHRERSDPHAPSG